MSNSSFSGHLANNQRFVTALGELDFLFLNAEDVRGDLVHMERSYPDPDDHQEALAAVIHHLLLIHRSDPGKDLQGPLRGWRRVAFESRKQSDAPGDLRIVYRIHQTKLELMGFGHRFLPTAVYSRVRKRLPREPQ